MDGRGGGDNGSVTSIVEGSNSREGGVKRCGQSRHQGTSASRWNKVTRCILCYIYNVIYTICRTNVVYSVHNISCVHCT